jgi:hypothetical protein
MILRSALTGINRFGFEIMHEPAASSSTASQIDQIDQILCSALMAMDRFEITQASGLIDRQHARRR